MADLKPLNWKKKENIGYTVARRADGGMDVHFIDLNDATIEDWKEFAFEHLFGLDRLTRNLYDLREVNRIPEKALKWAVAVNNDPSTRNLRVAVLVKNDQVRDAILNVVAGAIGGGAAIRVFTDLASAETWLENAVEQIL